MHRFLLAFPLLVASVGCQKTTGDESPPAGPTSLSTPASQPQNPQSQTSKPEDSLTILAWNVESGGADPKLNAKQLAAFDQSDIYCLSEVHPSDFATYREARGSSFASFDSKSGDEDRLQIIYNTDRFEMLEERELERYRDYVLNDGRHRSPIYVRLKDRKSGIEFVVMTNHLARGNEKFRNQQAIGLREWARDLAQSVGVISIGDFNMDYNFQDQRGNAALAEMLRDNVWVWAKPNPLVDTNWDDRDRDGKDNYPDSMLDFAFVAGPASEWSPECEVIVRDGDFPDDNTTSDHRPIELTLSPFSN
ncbi:endonuclease/exonuclease/phosphatase family protein [Aeoliella sp. SH292]|uniref:endonuclease/exonuclease/phosphatase family protein n=1 Tax=Aeoliella sp. SH292 TaxID=3454464 RepID=UPI003F9AC78E